MKQVSVVVYRNVTGKGRCKGHYVEKEPIMFSYHTFINDIIYVLRPSFTDSSRIKAEVSQRIY
jgi:hypothetical protein